MSTREERRTNACVPMDCISSVHLRVFEAGALRLRYLPPCACLVLNLGTLFVAESILVSWWRYSSLDV